MGSRPVGWYVLPNSGGVLYHGTLPDGVEEVDAPSEAGEQFVDAGESGTTVGTDVTGVELTAESFEISSAPSGVSDVEQDLDGDDGIGRHPGDGT